MRRRRVIEVVALLTVAVAPASALAGQSAEQHIEEAKRHLAEGQAARAVAAFEAAVRMEPGSGPARNALAALLNREGRYREAIVHAEAAVAARPDDGRYRYNRGVVRNELGLFGQAIEDFDAAVAAHPDLAYAYLERSSAHLALGRMDAARADVQRARRTDPKLIWSDWYEAILDFVDGRFDAAAAGFARVAADQPDFTAAAVWLPLARWRAGQGGETPAATGSTWSAPVTRYFGGTLSEDELLAAAQADQESGDDRRIGEALFFIARKDLARSRVRPAIDHLRSALTVQAPRHAWKVAAERELERLNAG